jgi:tetratricopeptide (TPR) repeat protein
MRFKYLIGVFLLGIAMITASFGQAQQAADTILVLPFENRSDKAEFNWVGESFAHALSDLLRVPGLNVVSNSERKMIQQRLGIPLTSIPSLATSLRLARESGATLLISGRYTIVPAHDDVAATINVTTRIIRVNEGRFLSEVIDGRQIQRDIVLNDALGNLQTMQGQIAYQILYQRDKNLAYSQNDKVVEANRIPARAFEAYIKGLLTSIPELRENFFKNAIRLNADSGSERTFVEAALELAHLYLGQRKFSDAINEFERVVNANQQCREAAKGSGRVLQCNDESFAEASFYIGVIRWQQGDLEQALAVLRPLVDEMRLTSVYNMLGAIAIQASRTERRDQARSAALLNEGIELLKTAADSAPDDLAVRFNYGLALFLQGDHLRSAEQMRKIVAESPRDGEAYYMLAKSLSQLNDETATTVDEQARIHLSAGNRYATLEREWAKTKTVPEMNMRVQQPQRREFVSVVLSRRDAEPLRVPTSGVEGLLEQARKHYLEGNDDEAMAVIRRILVSEPMSAESYVILGQLHLRRGDRDQAVSALKTALFWDNRLVEAHILLGRIFLERNDCQQVKTYAASAAEIAPDNSEVVSLGRQAERCSK